MEVVSEIVLLEVLLGKILDVFLGEDNLCGQGDL